MKFKKTLLATLAATALLSTAASALESANGFTYPDVTHTEQDTITHGVLFFYSDDMLSFFDNDPEKLLAYAQRNIDLNNDIFKRQDIRLRREVAGVVRLPDSLEWNDNNPVSASGLNYVNNFFKNNRAEYDTKFNASYFVLLNKKYDQGLGGRAKQGGFVSIVIPSSINELSDTLTHELGHNDGIAHKEDIKNYLANPDHASFLLSSAASSYTCDSISSIMSASGSRKNEFYFSSKDVYAANDEQCGDSDSDAAYAYTQIAPLKLKNKEKPLDNNTPVKGKTGTVGITVSSTIVDEGQDISVEVLWSGASIGDTVQLITKAGTALANIDYTPELFTITYDGTDSTTVTVKTIDDDKFENDKTMSLVLVNNNGINIDDNLATSIITIQSDDLAPVTPPVTPPANSGDESSGGSTSSGLLSLMLVALFTRKKWFSKA